MSAEETVDELVDKAIDEAIARVEKDNEDIKKRKPTPFRYLTDRKDIQAELASEVPSISTMKKPTTIRIVDDKLAILGLGDIQTIENVLRRHEATRKFKEK